MSWLRRLSRDRSSKADRDSSMAYRPSSSNYNDNHQEPFKDTQYSSTRQHSQDMMQSYRAPVTQDHQLSSPQRPPGTSSDATMHTAPSNMPAPDPLQRAFNDAIRPYLDQIEILKNQIEDSNGQIQQLEDERADMHAWIDKRGLRADVPPSISRAMNSDPMAAQTLNHHLDRKMTILNSDLHRLQDSLVSPLPTATFANTLTTLIPSIENLSALPHGPQFAFELLIKLGGNMNSHGGEEGWNSEVDSRSRADFYARLDECMVDVVRQRLGQGSDEDPPWDIKRDVKRLEKTGGFLRSQLGLQAYFPRSLDLMRYDVKRGDGQSGRVQRSP